MCQESSRHSVVAIEFLGMIRRAAPWRHPRRESFRGRENFFRCRTAAAFAAFRFEALLKRMTTVVRLSPVK
jgi:hypothetical protein